MSVGVTSVGAPDTRIGAPQHDHNEDSEQECQPLDHDFRPVTDREGL
jgi:hypothetical protein